MTEKTFEDVQDERRKLISIFRLPILVILVCSVYAQQCDLQIIHLTHRQNCIIRYRNCQQIGFLFQGCQQKSCLTYDFQQRRCIRFNFQQTINLSQTNCMENCCIEHPSSSTFNLQSLRKCQQDQIKIVSFDWKAPGNIVLLVLVGFVALALVLMIPICLIIAFRRIKKNKQEQKDTKQVANIQNSESIKILKRQNKMSRFRNAQRKYLQNEFTHEQSTGQLRKERRQRRAVSKINSRSYLTSIKLTKRYNPGCLQWTQILPFEKIFQDWHTCQVCSRIEPEVLTACEHYYHIKCIATKVQSYNVGSELCVACSKRFKGQFSFVCMSCKTKVKKMWVHPQLNTANQIVRKVGTNICGQCFHRR